MHSEPTGSSFWLGGAFVSLPIQAQSPTAVSISCQGQKGLRSSGKRERHYKKKVGGREMEGKKSLSYTSEGFCCTPPCCPRPPPFIKHCSTPLRPPPSPSLFSPSLLPNKHAPLRTHGVHSELLSLTSAVKHLAHALPLTPALEYTRTLGERRCHSTHSHMFCIPQCLSWLYIAP